MAYTYSKLASYTVGSSGVATVDFLAIPQNYTDLIIKVSNRNNRSGAINDAITLIFNGDTSNTTGKRMFGSGSSASSDTGFYAIDNASTSTANTFSNIEFYVPNYTSNTYKSWSADATMENNATAAYQTFVSGLWSRSEAITRIQVKTETGSTILVNSTFTIYGIKAEV